MKNEIWKDITGYEGLYQVSNQGRVKSLAREFEYLNRWGTMTTCPVKEIIRKPGLTKGHLFVPLYKDNVGKNHLIHRIVMEAFVSPCPEGMECCHNDGNPLNNCVENLRWDTHRNNHQDRILHGTNNFGANNGSAKINDRIVLQIRKLYRVKNWRLQDIAIKFGVTTELVRNVALYRTWSHVLEPISSGKKPN